MGLPVLITRSGGKPSRSRYSRAMVLYGMIDVADVIDDLAVDLLRHPLVEAAVPGFHVEDRDLPPLGRIGRQAAVRIAQDQERIGLLLLHARHRPRRMTLPTVSPRVCPAASRKWSGLRISRSLKKISFSS